MAVKECPFCGHVPDMDDPDTVYPNGIMWKKRSSGIITYHSTKEKLDGEHGQCYTFHCVKTAGGCGAEVMGNSAEEAIAKWNRRPGRMDPRLIALENLEPGDWVRFAHGGEKKDFYVVKNLKGQGQLVLLRTQWLTWSPVSLPYSRLAYDGYAYLGRTHERKWRKWLPPGIRGLVPIYPRPKKPHD